MESQKLWITPDAERPLAVRGRTNNFLTKEGGILCPLCFTVIRSKKLKFDPELNAYICPRRCVEIPKKHEAH